jgi:hypothetical protein
MRQAIITAAVIAVTGCSASSTPQPSTTPLGSSPFAATTAVAEACASAQLHVRFFYGGVDAGNDLGGLRIRNHSPRACTLTGTVSVRALDKQRHPLFLPRWLNHAATDLTLSSKDTRPYMVVSLAGEYRDDPKSEDLCSQRHEVVPAYWRLTTAAGSWTLPNQDPSSPNGGNPSASTGPGVEACRGNFAPIHLETVR